MNTQLGACAAMLAWMGVEWWRRRKPSGVGIAAGAVAGLAAITPASGYVPTWAALVIGAAAGLLCYGAVHLKDSFHYDDALDVVGVHMVGGAIGVVLTGVFASLAVNAAGEAGGWTQLGRQAVLAVAGIVYPFVMTWIILWITDHTVGLRVSPGGGGSRPRPRASTARSATSWQKRQADMKTDSMAAAPGAPQATGAAVSRARRLASGVCRHFPARWSVGGDFAPGAGSIYTGPARRWRQRGRV